MLDGYKLFRVYVIGMLAFLILVGVLASEVAVPIRVRGQVIVDGDELFTEVVAPASGPLYLLSSIGQSVKEGQPLATIRHPMSASELAELDTLIDGLGLVEDWSTQSLEETRATRTSPPNIALHIDQLRSAVEKLKTVAAGHVELERIAIHQDAVRVLDRRRIAAMAQLTQESMQLEAIEQLLNKIDLATESQISQIEYFRLQGTRLDAFRSAASVEERIAQLNQDIEMTKLDIEMIEEGWKSDVLDAASAVRTAYGKLAIEWENWLQRFVVHSPTDGTVLAMRVDALSNQALEGDEIAVIGREGHSAGVVKAFIPPSRAGLVAIGAKCQVTISELVSRGNQKLKGSVLEVSRYPLGDEYEVHIQLEGLSEDLRVGMTGSVEILVASTSVLKQLLTTFSNEHH